MIKESLFGKKNNAMCTVYWKRNESPSSFLTLLHCHGKSILVDKKNGQFSRTNYFRIKKGRDDSPAPSPWIRRTY